LKLLVSPNALVLACVMQQSTNRLDSGKKFGAISVKGKTKQDQKKKKKKKEEERSYCEKFQCVARKTICGDSGKAMATK
jgi:hypothetical protein